MALGPIPRSAIMDYAAEQGLFGDQAEHFAAIIRRVDNEYLSLSNKVSKTESGGRSADVTDVEATRNVMSVIKARAAEAHRVKTKGNGKP